MVALLILDEEKDLDAVATATLLQRNDPSISFMASREQAPHGQMLVSHVGDIEWLTLFCNARSPTSPEVELTLNSRRNGREGFHLLKLMTTPVSRLAGDRIERYQPENRKGSKFDHRSVPS